MDSLQRCQILTFPRGALGFSVLRFGQFFRSFFSVLVSFAVCGFCSISFSVSGFSANLKSGFRICYSAMQFGVFTVSIRKIRASTPLT